MDTPRLFGRPRLLLAQAASGALFAMFALAHVLTVLLAPIPGGFDAARHAFRGVYQHPLIEISVLLLPLVVHVGAGVLLATDRRRRDLQQKPDRWARAHRVSGWFLATVVLGHVGATRGLQLAYGIDTGASAIGYALWRWPLFFYPYFFALGVAGAYHTVFGLSRALRLLGARPPRLAPQWRVPLVSALAIAMLASVLGLAGHLFATDDPRRSDYARVLTELVGP